MTNKTKKITLLTAGIASTLLASSVAAVTLSACTFQATLPPDFVNPNAPKPTPQPQYNNEINWNLQAYPTDSPWTPGQPLSVNMLEKDEAGFVYADKAHTQLIAMLPNTNATEITIPAQVKQISGYVKVEKDTSTNQTTKTSLAAFQDNLTLRQVKFAAGSQLQAINTNAFKGCKNLQTIELPSSVKTIQDSAFQDTTNLTSINLNNVTYIGDNAFQNAFDTASVDTTLHLNNVLRIGNNAFENVTGVNAIDLTSNTKLLSIGESAFKGAKLAATFDLSTSKALSTIGTSAFENTTGLQTIKLADTFGFSANALGTGVFKNSSLTSIDLTNTKITSVPANTFENASKLASVILPDQVTTFGANAFSGTSSLATLSLPTQLTSITTAFKDTIGTNPSNLSGITELDFSKTQVTTFDQSAFEGANKLTKITLNDQFTTISTSAFKNASSLATVGVAGTPTGTVALPDSFTGFQASASQVFTNTAITSVDFSKTTLTALDNNIFSGNASITSVKYPSSLTTLTKTGESNSLSNFQLADVDLSNTQLTEVGDSAFRWAKALTSVTLPDTITAIQNNAFQDTSIATIEIPSTITSIGNYSFNNTPNLTTITVKDVQASTPSGRASESSLPSSLTSLGVMAFNNSGITSMDLSKTQITQIQNDTFANCPNLTSITLPETITTIGQRILANSGTAAGITMATQQDMALARGIGQVKLPKSITKIEDYAFQDAGITSIDLSQITTFKTQTNSSMDWYKYGLPTAIFKNASQLTSVTLPNWVKGTIPTEAFAGTTALTSVVVAPFGGTAPKADPAPGFDISGSNITGFTMKNASGESAPSHSHFLNSGLASFKFPEKFDRTTIPANAFNGTKLTEVKTANPTSNTAADKYHILGPTTTTISANAFSNITTLTSVELPETLTSLPQDAFANISPTATVKYPSGMKIATGTASTENNAFKNSPLTEIDLSTSDSLTTLAEGTFNGSKLTNLTLPAKAVQWKTTETQVGEGPTKSYSNNPLYNNNDTLNITFTMFKKSDGTNSPSSFADIDNHVKQQIANIMNMFSRYAPTKDLWPVQYDDWTAGTPPQANQQGNTKASNSGRNNWITSDLTIDNLFSDWEPSSSATGKNQASGGQDQAQNPEPANGATKNHNGVTWTYSKTGGASAPGAGGAGGAAGGSGTPGGKADAATTITITSDVASTPINIYRTISTGAAGGAQVPGNQARTQWDGDTNGGKFQDNQGRQTYFSMPMTNGAPSTSLKVQVTMKIVTAASKN